MPLSLTLVSGAWACGACDEDKMAATYDDAVVQQATAAHRAIAFFSLDASGAMTPAIVDDCKRSAMRLAGIDGQTVRASTEPAALSFAFDPTKDRAGTLLDTLNHKLARVHVTARLIRVIDSASSKRF